MTAVEAREPDHSATHGPNVLIHQRVVPIATAANGVATVAVATKGAKVGYPEGLSVNECGSDEDEEAGYWPARLISAGVVPNRSWKHFVK